MTFLSMFASFIFLSVLSAFIVFKFFRSRKTKSLLIVSQAGFENGAAKNKPLNKSIFKSTKKKTLIPAEHFILSSEEKDLRKLQLSSMFKSELSSQMVIIDLAEYLFKNLRITELLNATTYHAIPLDSNDIPIPSAKLKTLKLVTKDDFFSEKGFMLLCTIAKYIDVMEIGTGPELNNPLKA